MARCSIYRVLRQTDVLLFTPFLIKHNFFYFKQTCRLSINLSLIIQTKRILDVLRWRVSIHFFDLACTDSISGVLYIWGLIKENITLNRRFPKFSGCVSVTVCQRKLWLFTDCRNICPVLNYTMAFPDITFDCSLFSDKGCFYFYVKSCCVSAR